MLFWLDLYSSTDHEISGLFGSRPWEPGDYPDNPLVPKAYFRIAQIFHDRLMNKDQAKRALDLLLKKYPNHDIIPQAESFLARL